MAHQLDGARVAILAADGVEREELEMARSVVRGRTLTSWPSVWTDIRNAGGKVVDQAVVIDGQFTTSRSPHGLPAFCRAIVEQFASARQPVAT